MNWDFKKSVGINRVWLFVLFGGGGDEGDLLGLSNYFSLVRLEVFYLVLGLFLIGIS